MSLEDFIPGNAARVQPKVVMRAVAPRAPFLLSAGGLASCRALLLALLAAAGSVCVGQAVQTDRPPVDLTRPPAQWAAAAAATEEQIINAGAEPPLAYKVRRHDAHGEVLRQIIESRDGAVARLIQREGQPLTPEANEAERKRLQDILDDPTSYLRHVQREDGSRSYALELLHGMAGAMRWSYAPGQPQLADTVEATVVLDFAPDPHYRPPNLITDALTGIAGRVWVGAESHAALRIDGRILHPVNFGWGGVLARIREGGTVVFEQRRAANGRWISTHLVEHLSIREVLVHTAEENAEVSAFDIHPLPAPLSLQEAVGDLLRIPVPTH